MPAQKAPTKVSLLQHIRRGLFRPKRLFILALVLAFAVGLRVLKERLPQFIDRPEYRMKSTDIRIVDLPRWVPPDVVEQAASNAGLPVELSVLDDDVVEDVAAAFQLHPWVARVNRVSKFVPARIEVDLTFRRPVAMVQVKSGMYPIDVEGIRLPPADFSVADTKRFLVITNVRSTPQGPVGTSWGDPAVIGAARLAEVLGQKRKDFELVGIQVVAPDSERENAEHSFELITRGGSHIVWGRSPRSNHPGELTVEQKVGRLEQYLNDFGTFDGPQGPYEIDIRHWKEISRRPLATAQRRYGRSVGRARSTSRNH
jgi:hypothetical protein